MQYVCIHCVAPSRRAIQRRTNDNAAEHPTTDLRGNHAPRLSAVRLVHASRSCRRVGRAGLELPLLVYLLSDDFAWGERVGESLGKLCRLQPPLGVPRGWHFLLCLARRHVCVAKLVHEMPRELHQRATALKATAFLHWSITAVVLSVSSECSIRLRGQALRSEVCRPWCRRPC
jgi:hypothetical protein